MKPSISLSLLGEGRGEGLSASTSEPSPNPSQREGKKPLMLQLTEIRPLEVCSGNQPGGPSSPFLPFFLAGSASRGRVCAGVAAGAAGLVSLGVSVFVRGSGGTSVFGAGG